MKLIELFKGPNGARFDDGDIVVMRTPGHEDVGQVMAQKKDGDKILYRVKFMNNATGEVEQSKLRSASKEEVKDYFARR